MRSLMVGVAVGAGVVCGGWLLAGGGQQAWGQRGRPPASVEGASIVVATAATPSGGQQLVLVDTQDRVMSSYLVDGETGAIALKSVRSFRWDLLMDEFNGGDPKPKEIRALLEQR